MHSGSADKHLESEDSRMVELHCEIEFCCSGLRQLGQVGVARISSGASTHGVRCSLHDNNVRPRTHTRLLAPEHTRTEVTPAPSAYEISLILFSYCGQPKSLWPLAAPSSFLPNFASSILPVCRLRASGFPGSRRNDSRRVRAP